MKRLIVVVLFSLAFVSCQKNHLAEINTPFPKPTGGSTVGTEETSFTKLSEIDLITRKKTKKLATILGIK